MSIVCFAQNFEDVMLWRALKDIETGFYIDVGAAWPVEHSVTKLFYEHGWRGINIEPNPALHALLEADRRRDINLRVAIADDSGSRVINLIGDTGLSTIDPAIARRHRDCGFSTEEAQVAVTTLADIWDRHVQPGQEVHFLKIDVEGLETAVIRGNDWASNRPWIVVVEATLPLSQEDSYADWERILLSSGYAFVYADGLNRFYLAQERATLETHFQHPPNVFDDFVLHGQRAAEEHANRSEAQAELAGTRAREAEERLSEVEALMEEARSEARQARDSATLWEARAHTYENSLSWWITTPFRQINARGWALFIIRQVDRWSARFPKPGGRVTAMLQRYPALSSLTTNGITVEASPAAASKAFESIELGAVELLFAKGPLGDARGIGRVSRELLGQLRSMAREQAPTHAGPPRQRTPVHFYGSVHWCPDRLPDNSVVMIHDVIPLLFSDKFPADVRHVWAHRYKPIVQQAARVVTISQSSARDIARLLDIPERKISIIYNGVTALPVAEAASVPLPRQPYLVFLGSHDHHKNINVVLRALTDTRVEAVRLVLVGDNEGCLPQVEALGLEGRVEFLGRLEDGALGRVLSEAVALVFPSLYEGFGLPPLEAALLGTPAICSRRPAMTELLEDAALFADPEDPAAWAAAIAQLAGDAEGRLSLAARAQATASGFTWPAAARRLLEVVESLAD